LKVSAEHKHDFVATEQAGEMWASVDGAMHKVEQQLRKYKQKVQEHHREPGLRQQGFPKWNPSVSNPATVSLLIAGARNDS